MKYPLAMLFGAALFVSGANASPMECAPVTNAMAEAQFDRFNAAWASTAKARYTFVYRFADGAWRIEHLHSSLLPDMP